MAVRPQNQVTDADIEQRMAENGKAALLDIDRRCRERARAELEAERQKASAQIVDDDGPDLKRWANRERTVTAYMCEIAWEHELGADADGTVLYSTLECLDAGHKVPTCGVVEVEVRLKRVVRPDTDNWRKRIARKQAKRDKAATIETRTLGDDRPVMRDFLTKTMGAGTYGMEPQTKWVDDAGRMHRTRAAMRKANRKIKADGGCSCTDRQRTKNGPPAPPPEPSMWKGA